MFLGENRVGLSRATSESSMEWFGERVVEIGDEVQHALFQFGSRMESSATQNAPPSGSQRLFRFGSAMTNAVAGRQSGLGDSCRPKIAAATSWI